MCDDRAAEVIVDDRMAASWDVYIESISLVGHTFSRRIQSDVLFSMFNPSVFFSFELYLLTDRYNFHVDCGRNLPLIHRKNSRRAHATATTLQIVTFKLRYDNHIINTTSFFHSKRRSLRESQSTRVQKCYMTNSY